MNDNRLQELIKKLERGEQWTEDERLEANMLLQQSRDPNMLFYKEQNTTTPPLNPYDIGSEYVVQNDGLTDQMRSDLFGDQGIQDPLLQRTPEDFHWQFEKGKGINFPEEKTPPPPPNPWDINNIPLIYPGGTDLSTELYSLGRGLGMEKGTKGRGAMIAGGAGAAILGGTRDVLSGLGYEKQQTLTRDWYRARQQDNTYTPVSQTRNTNNTGGFDFKYGGEFKSYEDGGEMMQQQMAPEQQEMLQQVQMFVVEMMQQGAEPQQIVQELVQNGVPQEQAVMLVEQVMMQMQQQQVPQEMVPQQAIPQEQPMQPQVGQEVSFKYGGKKVSGKIKKIENGKIYL
jgi:hypothetical protein